MQAHNESVNFGGKCCKWAEVKRRCGDPELGDYRLDSLCAAMSLFWPNVRGLQRRSQRHPGGIERNSGMWPADFSLEITLHIQDPDLSSRKHLSESWMRAIGTTFQLELTRRVAMTLARGRPWQTTWNRNLRGLGNSGTNCNVLCRLEAHYRIPELGGFITAFLKIAQQIVTTVGV